MRYPALLRFRLILTLLIAFSITRSVRGIEVASDGPPINLTCVGLQVPATVHVSALVRHTEDRPVSGSVDVPATVPAGKVDPSPLASRFLWDFGDLKSDYNTLPGWNAAHVYERPGRYTITLTVTDSLGHAHQRTSWVRVIPEDRRHIFCASAGNDANDGTAPERAVRSVQRAVEVAKSDAVILFRRGDRFDMVRPAFINARNLRLTSYHDPLANPLRHAGDSGAAVPRPATQPSEPDPDMPVLFKVETFGKEDTMLYINQKCQNITIDNLMFDSSYTLKSAGYGRIPVRAIEAAGINCSILNCAFRNVNDGINAELQPTGLLVQDCKFSNEIRDYGIFGCGTDHAYIGNLMLNSMQEHLIRVTEPGVTRLLIAYNELSRPNNGKGCIELRNANWFYVAGNTIDGGTMRVGPQEQDKIRFPTWASIRCTWGVVQDNRFNDIFCNVRPGTEHVIFRDNLVHERGDEENNWAFIVSCTAPGYDTVRKVVDVRIERNTAVNDGAIGQFIVVIGHPFGVTLKDNLYVAPRLRAVGDRGWSVFLFDNDTSGFSEVGGNVWPAGPGGLHHWNKLDQDRGAWTSAAHAVSDRYEDVTLDADDNPPAGFSAGAKLPPRSSPRAVIEPGPWGKLPRQNKPLPPAPKGQTTKPAA